MKNLKKKVVKIYICTKRNFFSFNFAVFSCCVCLARPASTFWLFPCFCWLLLPLSSVPLPFLTCLYLCVSNEPVVPNSISFSFLSSYCLLCCNMSLRGCILSISPVFCFQQPSHSFFLLGSVCRQLENLRKPHFHFRPVFVGNRLQDRG